MVFMNKRNSKAYESVKTALETLEKIILRESWETTILEFKRRNYYDDHK